MRRSMYFNRIGRYLQRLRDNIIGVNQLKDSISHTEYLLRRMELMNHLLTDTSPGVTDERYADYDIVVSLTSFGKRVNDVALTIESIMFQTVLPNKIVLWLDESFREKELPKMLRNLEKRGLQIEFCEDIRSYKKLVPSLIKFPNDAIITLDDDLLYDYQLLEHLIEAHKSDHSCIWASRARKIVQNGRGGVVPYSYWPICNNNVEPSHLILPTTGGGTLYPPGSFDDEVINKDVFMSICPYADDIWFKAMALKKGTVCKKAFTTSSVGKDYLENPDVQDVGLFQINLGSKMNDKQFDDVFCKYDLYNKLSSKI